MLFTSFHEHGAGKKLNLFRKLIRSYHRKGHFSFRFFTLQIYFRNHFRCPGRLFKFLVTMPICYLACLCLLGMHRKWSGTAPSPTRRTPGWKSSSQISSSSGSTSWIGGTPKLTDEQSCVDSKTMQVTARYGPSGCISQERANLHQDTITGTYELTARKLD